MFLKNILVCLKLQSPLNCRKVIHCHTYMVFLFGYVEENMRCFIMQDTFVMAICYSILRKTVSPLVRITQNIYKGDKNEKS